VFKAVGSRIRAERKNGGYSQERLAELAGIHHTPQNADQEIVIGVPTPTRTCVLILRLKTKCGPYLDDFRASSS
jgi:transcriptional regulator with XRE-family HTH domain